MFRARFTSAVRFATFCFLSAFLIGGIAQAQMTGIDETTATPVEGAGHDYIHFLSETVNPATGSISLRIQLPTPKGRGLSLPFSIDYDSGSVNHLVAGYYPNYGVASWSPNVGTLFQGGWSYSVPSAGSTYSSPIEGQYPNFYNCVVTSNYVFRDSSGGLHPLGLGTSFGPGPTGTVQDCQEYPVATGGDSQFRASLPWPGSSFNCTSCSPPPTSPLTVTSADGTVYYFANVPSIDSSFTKQDLGPPTYIEDRNGNRITASSSGSGTSFQFSFTDTLGRTLFSSSGFGPSGTTNNLYVGGLLYKVTWKTISANFSTPNTYVGSIYGPAPGGYNYWSCSGIPSNTNHETVISQITLPNNRSYTFYYGTDTTPHGASTNPYGLLSEIDYPSGAWVKYSWSLSPVMNEVADYTGNAVQGGTSCSTDPSAYCPSPVQDGCLYQYKTPVITSRTVSFGGPPALTQTFSYAVPQWAAALNNYVGSISWTQKSTTVYDQDNLTGKTTSTIFTYVPVAAPTEPYSRGFGAEIPVEQAASFYDIGNSLLRTTYKGWLVDQSTPFCQVDALPGGLTSGVWNIYNAHYQPTNKKEYDYGQASSGSCSGVVSFGSYQQMVPAVTPTRETVINYQTFSSTPVGGTLYDRPSSVITYGSGTRAAETDYLYDQGGTSGPTGITGHDDANYPSGSGVVRGNLTTKTRDCFVGSTNCQNSVTTYAYDQTGQIVSSTDGCGNPNGTCADMSGSNPNHTTTYSYSDHYTTLSGGQNQPYMPAGNTNAYLTSLTDPLLHTASFKYDFNNGQLTSATDANNQTTTYIYNDFFSRPTLATRPDFGTTAISYDDSAYSSTANTPSVTTTLAIASGVNRIDISAMDGAGHVVRTILNSDPDAPSGGDITDMTYEGFGRTLTVSNPHRSATSSTDGTTAYTYDALGRTTSVRKQDNSTISTVYDQTSPNSAVTCSTTTDEASKSRKSCTDGLGRLAQVFEDPAGSNYETDYQYDILNNLLRVDQKGNDPNSANWRTRLFTYDSLSRLLTASNPESGTMTYTYDANGNVVTRTAPMPNQPNSSVTVTTTYQYDPLNRVIQKSYSDGTPTATFYYDTAPSAWATGEQNTTGRLVEATTGHTPEP